MQTNTTFCEQIEQKREEKKSNNKILLFMVQAVNNQLGDTYWILSDCWVAGLMTIRLSYSINVK